MSFVFPATCSPSFVIPATVSTSPQQFKEALPKLVPKRLREHVLFFMKDGDPQQRNEILSAMKNVFVNASEGTYGFHVKKRVGGPMYQQV